MEDPIINLGNQSLPQHGDDEVIPSGSDAGKTVGELRGEVFGPPGTMTVPIGLPRMPRFLQANRSLAELRAEAHERADIARLKAGMRGHLLAFPEAYQDEDRVLLKLANLMPLATEEEAVATAALVVEAERIRARQAARSRARQGKKWGRAAAKGAFGGKKKAEGPRPEGWTCFYCEKPFTVEETRYRLPTLGAPAYGRDGLVAHTRCIPNYGNPRSGGA